MLIAGVAAAVGAAAWFFSENSSSSSSSSGGEKTSTSGSGTDAQASSANSGTNALLNLRGSTASASSKVLLTGGYLILEPAYSGLVLALDARFRTTLLQLTPTAASVLSLPPPTNHSATVIVYAPQRSAVPSRYELSWDPALQSNEASSGGWKITSLVQGQEKNKFVEQAIVVSGAQTRQRGVTMDPRGMRSFAIALCLLCFARVQYSLLFLSSVTPSPSELVARIGHGWVLYLEGDYQFYSAVKPEREEGSAVPPVVPDGSKTGLGSSAALVSSIVAAMFKHFQALGPALPYAAPQPAAASSSMSVGGSSSSSPALPFRCMPLSTRLSLAHNLAQLIHCSAQGKVGSGFDVSTAFHGSQIYRRFTPQVLTECLSLSSQGASASPTSTAASIPRGFLMRQLVDSSPDHGWNYSVTRFSLPPGLVVVLGDVAGGASTPVMVKKVLEWRARDKEGSTALWTKLNDANTKIQSLFAELSTYAADHELEYKSVRVLLAKQPASQWEMSPAGSLPAGQLFCALSATFYLVRQFLREMGSAAGVDIEPAASQALLDSTVQSRGVLIAGVPGAGGDDAIFAVLLDDAECSAALDQRWASYVFPGEGQEQRKVRRLQVREEKDTIKFEDAQVDVGVWGLGQR